VKFKFKRGKTSYPGFFILPGYMFWAIYLRGDNWEWSFYCTNFSQVVAELRGYWFLFKFRHKIGNFRHG